MNAHGQGRGAGVPRWLVVAGAFAWRALAVGAVAYYLALGVASLQTVVFPFLLALLITALFEPTVSWAARLLPRSIAALLLLLLALAALAGFLTIVGVGIAGQIAQASDSIQRGVQRLSELVGGARSSAADPSAASPLLTALGELRSRAGALASGVVSGTETLFVIASESLLALAFAFFLLRDGEGLFRHALGALRPRHRDPVQRSACRAWGTLGSYLRGLALVALANALEKGLVLLLLDVPMVLPIMLLTLIGSFIPFAGPIIAGAVAALVALADASVVRALLVVAASLLIQIIEGNVWQPLILGRTMSLHPVVILGAVTTGAILAGLPGAFFAIPLLAALRAALAPIWAERASERAAEDRDT